MFFYIIFSLFSLTINARLQKIKPVIQNNPQSYNYKSTRSPQVNTPIDLYLELLKLAVTNSIYQDFSCHPHQLRNPNFNQYNRENGLDWPNIAHTMIGLHRLDNIQFCIEDILKNNIEGDLIETGVWRGGATIFMRGILKVYNNTEKKVFAADSFEGLPPSNGQMYPADKPYDFTQYKVLAVSLEEVQSNFARYGLLDNQVVFLKGFFKDTLPSAPIEKIALLRLDGDLYESTMDALVNLYPKLSVGGYVIVDDYGALPCCKQAIHDFREQNNITDEILHVSDNIAIYWKRTK